MNDRLLDYAIRIQSIAQAGLQYGKDKYDRERYAELREIAAEMISAKWRFPCGESPRSVLQMRLATVTCVIDTRSRCFIDGKSSRSRKQRNLELALRLRDAPTSPRCPTHRKGSPRGSRIHCHVKGAEVASSPSTGTGGSTMSRTMLRGQVPGMQHESGEFRKY